MRCLNCNTLVADHDPRCQSCGARCTTPEKDRPRMPAPVVGIILLLAGIFGHTFLVGPVPKAEVQDHKTIAYVWGLVGFFVGLAIDLFLWSRGQRRWPADQPPQSWQPAPLAPGAIPPRQPIHVTEQPTAGRSGIVR